MRHTLVPWILFFTLAVSAAGAPPDDQAKKPVDATAEVEAFLESWSKTFKDLDTLEVTFRQEKRLKILRKPLVSSGTIRLAEKALVCTVRNSKGELETAMQIRDRELRLYYPALRRLEIYELGASRAPALAFPIFGADPKALKKDFRVKLEKIEEKRRLVLTPRNPGAPIGMMAMTFKDSEVTEVEQIDRSGNITRMKILGFVRNKKLRAADLELVIPPGTREVRPLSHKKKG